VSALVLLVNGISATGKTTIGRAVSAELRLPFFSKDVVKETLFDEFGIKDRAWAHKLSGVTHAILNPILEEELQAGRGFVLEANFNPAFDKEKFERWLSLYDFEIVQVLFFAAGGVGFSKSRPEADLALHQGAPL